MKAYLKKKSYTKTEMMQVGIFSWIIKYKRSDIP